MNHACLIIISVINLLQEFGLRPTKCHNSLFPSTYLDMKHTPLPPAETPGLSDLNDEKLLYGAFEKDGFKNIQIEKVKVTFKFDTAEDYTKFTQHITIPVNAMVKNQSKEHIVQKWNIITQEVSKLSKIHNYQNR